MLQIAGNYFRTRDRRREERQRLLSLIDEVDRIQERNVALRQVFDEDLQNREFERKMREDARYFVYLSEGKPSQKVFDTKTKDFSFLNFGFFKIIIEYYDTQSLIYQCMTDLRSSLFRELSIPRKISTLEDIVKLSTTISKPTVFSRKA